MQKFGHDSSYIDILASLKRLYKNLSEFIKTFVAEKDGKIVGYLLAFFKNGVLYPKFIGLDRMETKNVFAYFNLAYYDLIKWSIKSNETKKIYYGYASELVKLERGCQSHNGYCYYKLVNNKVHKWLGKFIKHYNNARLGYFRSKYQNYVLEKEDSFLHEEQ